MFTIGSVLGHSFGLIGFSLDICIKCDAYYKIWRYGALISYSTHFARVIFNTQILSADNLIKTLKIYIAPDLFVLRITGVFDSRFCRVGG